jgi:hypothetical protein
MKFLSQHPATTGLIFGIFVWFVMNLVILPLSNIPPLPFRLIPAAIGMGILILAIGMPVSFLASRYFSRNE